MREASVGCRMFQRQGKAVKRADAEGRYRLDVFAWAQGEELCDCHSDFQSGWRAAHVEKIIRVL
ncbi:hypothetical protein D3Z58_15970 [Clostridiaceae bacterium]|nr:hypothetical protein [Clostridiaceae bacterium]